MKRSEFIENIHNASKEARAQFGVCRDHLERQGKVLAYGVKHGLFSTKDSMPNIEDDRTVFRLLMKLSEFPGDYRLQFENFMVLEFEIEQAWESFQRNTVRELQVLICNGVPVCGACGTPIHLGDDGCTSQSCQTIPLWSSFAIKAWQEKYGPR